MKKSRPQEKPAIIVIWVIDDELEQEMLSDHIRNGLKDCVEHLAGGRLAKPQLDKKIGQRAGTSAFMGALLWKYTLSFPVGAIQMECPVKRPVEFVVFGFGDWDSPTRFLAGNIAGPAGDQVWPQVVFTDLHKGTRSYPTRPSDVRELAGYQFAMRCLEHNIPCVTFTSGEAVNTHPYVFHGQDMLLPFDREEFKIGGKIAEAFEDRLWPRLSRRFWIPDFTLTVEGRKNKNHKSFTVKFYDAAGQPVSIANVSRTKYTYLYLWCYGSIAARLFDWPCESTAMHPAIANPHNIDSTRQLLFEQSFYHNRRKTIFWVPGGDLSQRSADILNANIRHLDVPITSSFPTFWDNYHLATRLKADMQQILPEDGQEWLETVVIPPPPSSSSKVASGATAQRIISS